MDHIIRSFPTLPSKPKSNRRVNWIWKVGFIALSIVLGEKREWESGGQNLGDKEPRGETENQILLCVCVCVCVCGLARLCGLWCHAFSAHLWLAAQFSLCWELKDDYLPEIQTFQGSFESLLVVVTTWAVSALDNHIMRLSGTEVALSPHSTFPCEQ